MKRTVFVLIVFILSLVTMCVGIFKQRDDRAMLTETALSLYAKAFAKEGEISREDTAKIILTFSDLPTELNEKLISTAKKGVPDIEIINLLKYFRFSKLGIRQLSAALEGEAPTIAMKINSYTNADEVVQKLINEVYYGVTFNETTTESQNTAYYCSNLFICATENDEVVIFNNVSANSEEDLLAEWIYKNEEAVEESSTKENGLIKTVMKGKNVRADVYRAPENMRIIAAKITLNKDE